MRTINRRQAIASKSLRASDHPVTQKHSPVHTLPRGPCLPPPRADMRTIVMHLVTTRLHVFSSQDFQSFVVSLVWTLLEAFCLSLSLSLLLQSSIAASIILALSLDVIVF